MKCPVMSYEMSVVLGLKWGSFTDSELNEMASTLTFLSVVVDRL